MRYADPESENTARARRRGRSAGQHIALERERNGKLSPQAAYDKAREVALTLLDTQARSSGEIAQRLELRGFDARTVQAVVDRLLELSLLDDRSYADMLVRTRFSERGLVGQALRAELAKKCITGAVAEAAMAQIGHEDVAHMALVLARKKVRTSPGVDPQRLRRRVVSFLGRKGYGLSAALTAFEAAMAAGAED